MSTDVYNSSIDLLRSLDWQRSNDDVLKQIIQLKQDWYQENHCDFWNDWVVDVFSLKTANDFGLSVWSIILDEPLFGVTKASLAGFKAWGFGSNRKNFNNGNFGTNDDSGFNFTTEQRRIILRLKAFILHMSGTVHGSGKLSINTALSNILGSNKIICVDNRDMSFTYVVYDSELKGLALELYKRDLLPRPAAIKIGLVYDGGNPSWGYGDAHANYNNGNFNDGLLVG